MGPGMDEDAKDSDIAHMASAMEEFCDDDSVVSEGDEDDQEPASRRDPSNADMFWGDAGKAGVSLECALTVVPDDGDHRYVAAHFSRDQMKHRTSR